MYSQILSCPIHLFIFLIDGVEISDVIPTSDFYLSTILSLSDCTLLQGEHMYGIPKTLHGVKNTQVHRFLELFRKCSHRTGNTRK